MTKAETDPGSRIGSVLAATFVWAASRPLPTRNWRQLVLAGVPDLAQTKGWRVRVLSARYDAIWGQDTAFQRRTRTLLLPDPDLLSEDELLALCLNRLDRLGIEVPWADPLSLALSSARRRLRQALEHGAA